MKDSHVYFYYFFRLIWLRIPWPRTNSHGMTKWYFLKQEPIAPKQTNQYVGPLRKKKCMFSFLEKDYSDRSKLLYAVSTF